MRYCWFMCVSLMVLTALLTACGSVGVEEGVGRGEVAGTEVHVANGDSAEGETGALDEPRSTPTTVPETPAGVELPVQETATTEAVSPVVEAQATESETIAVVYRAEVEATVVRLDGAIETIRTLLRAAEEDATQANDPAWEMEMVHQAQLMEQWLQSLVDIPDAMIPSAYQQGHAHIVEGSRQMQAAMVAFRQALEVRDAEALYATGNPVIAARRQIDRGIALWPGGIAAPVVAPEGWVLHEGTTYSLIVPETWSVVDPLDEVSAEAFARDNPALTELLQNTQTMEPSIFMASAPTAQGDPVASVTLRRSPIEEGVPFDRALVLSLALAHYEEAGVDVLEANAQREIGGREAVYLRIMFVLTLADGSTAPMIAEQYMVQDEVASWVLSYGYMVAQADAMESLVATSAESLRVKGMVEEE